MTETEKLLESILMQIAQVNANLTKLTERVSGLTVDLSEFGDRFDEVVSQLEAERRLDLIRDSYQGGN